MNCFAQPLVILVNRHGDFFVSFRFVSALSCFVSVVSRFVSFLLVSFRFVSVSFLVLQWKGDSAAKLSSLSMDK